MTIKKGAVNRRIPRKILVTGASGFVGSAVVSFFRNQGDTVVRLTRHNGSNRTDTICWNPEQEEIDLDDFEGLDLVIHLAGENVAERWTKRKKEAIFLSRVRDTWLLCQALSRLKTPPKLFFSASAVGYYGSCGDEIVTENHEKGNGFLSDVCEKWESASEILVDRGVRVVHGRFGAVISPEGGMIKKVLPLFRLGLGGRLGTGEQWMSWISLNDLVRAIDFVIENREAVGTFNFTAPHPVTNREFTQLIARSVHRPAFLPVPAWLIKLIYGEMGEALLLSTIRAVPERLLALGFHFNKPGLSLEL